MNDELIGKDLNEIKVSGLYHQPELRGSNAPVAILDDAGFKTYSFNTPPEAVNETIELTWEPVEGAEGYRVLTWEDIKHWEQHQRYKRKLRAMFNRRKKQARARTGRR
jgi:hypothetical protein